MTNVDPSPMSIQTGISSLNTKSAVLTNYLTCYFSVLLRPAIGKSNAFLTNLNNTLGYKRDSLKTKPKSITRKLINFVKNYFIYTAYFFTTHLT
jgi:hypothetical protein